MQRQRFKRRGTLQSFQNRRSIGNMNTIKAPGEEYKFQEDETGELQAVQTNTTRNYNSTSYGAQQLSNGSHNATMQETDWNGDSASDPKLFWIETLHRLSWDVNLKIAMDSLQSLALFWHGNLQSYFLFFSMAGTYRAATTDLTEAALNYSCGLFDVLQIVRNILVQMEMRKGFKPGAPPSSDCMETACAYTVDPLMRLALGIRDSLALLADVRRRIDEFRAYYDDDDDAERRS